MAKQQEEKKAVILLSGGQDSATCLAWALHQNISVRALLFSYEQRHIIELEYAKRLCRKQGVQYDVLEVPQFYHLAANSLTHDKPIDVSKGSLPSTFVPGRNLIFLSLAASYAYKWGMTTLITGVCETDYSGYPDCRDTFIKSTQETISLALDSPFEILTPLMYKTKAQTVEMMANMKVLDWYKDTHTCYEGLRPACGRCPSCQLRLAGFKKAGFRDPISYQSEQD